MDFLRQLAYENANLADLLKKFNENMPHSCCESSEDKCDFTASQFRSSSQRKTSQHEMEHVSNVLSIQVETSRMSIWIISMNWLNFHLKIQMKFIQTLIRPYMC